LAHFEDLDHVSSKVRKLELKTLKMWQDCRALHLRLSDTQENIPDDEDGQGTNAVVHIVLRGWHSMPLMEAHEV